VALAILSVISSSSLEAGETRIPFDDRGGLIWVPVYIDGSKPLNFLLDSGAEQSVIDLRTAKKLGVELVGRERVACVGGDETAYNTAPVTLRLSKSTAWSGPLLGLDLGRESRTLHRRIDGLIGMDFLADRTICIDYASKLVEFDAVVPRRHYKAIPIHMFRGNPCVTLTINKTQVLSNVRIDTGCNQSLHWSPTKTGQSARTERRTIGYWMKKTRTQKIDVSLGAIRFEEVATTRHRQPIFPGENGLLGNPLLARGGMAILDFRKKRLILSGR
jgi:hypothetical protein